MKRIPLIITALGFTALLAACDPADPLPDPAGATCLVGAADCGDGAFGHVADESDARSLLGLRQDQLPDDVRIARVDDEHFALTEDYRIGRLTVSIDDGRVTSVVLEAEDGPITVE